MFFPGEALGHHGYAAPYPLLPEQVLVIIGEQLQLNPGLLEQRIPGEPRARVVVGWVQPVLLQARIPERLEDVGQPEHICPAVEVALVAEVGAPEGGPDFVCVTVVGGGLMPIR